MKRTPERKQVAARITALITACSIMAAGCSDFSVRIVSETEVPVSPVVSAGAAPSATPFSTPTAPAPTPTTAASPSPASASPEQSFVSSEPSAAPSSPTPVKTPADTATPASSPAATSAATNAPAKEDPSRTVYSWYYMKKQKGEVPDFPKETKSYKPEHKVVWVGEGKKVYLTFDTGGPMGDIDKMLNTLKENGVKANYFIAGYNIRKNPDFLRRLVEDGHFVANHSMSHKDFTTLTDEQVKQELAEYEALYKEITGLELPKAFRFPYGRYSFHLLDLLAEEGYTSYFWSTAMRDWEPRENGPDDAFNDIMNNLHDGNIILMHQGSEDNINALDRIIKAIKEEGYEFGLLSDFQ